MTLSAVRGLRKGVKNTMQIIKKRVSLGARTSYKWASWTAPVEQLSCEYVRGKSAVIGLSLVSTNSI